MRIRKRPSLQSLCSTFLKSDPPKAFERPKATGGEAGAVERDPTDPPVRAIPTQHSLLKEEKIQVVDASPPPPPPSSQHTLDSKITGERKSSVWCNEGSDAKGKKKGSVQLMEGSRCSRVNGRGWRCCQQTLVGYSLCEHHLGKGRLRSMSGGGGVRGSSKLRSTGTSTRKIKNASGAREKEGARTIGTMKARSISSLLDETDHAAAAIISSLATSASK